MLRVSGGEESNPCNYGFLFYSCVQCFQPFPDGVFFEVNSKGVSHYFSPLPLYSKKEGVTVSRTLRPFMLHVAVDVVCTRKKLPYIRIINTRNNRKIYSGNLLVWPPPPRCAGGGAGLGYFTENFYRVFLGDFVIGRVIRAVSQSWHPKCFKCVSCHCELADVGFVKNQGR